MAQPGLLHHGGCLRQAAAHYGIPLAQWLDISTGINPNGWPVPAIPSSAWARLPEANDSLEPAACAYYDVKHILPVAGSQAAIQALPRLRPPSRVNVLHPGYAEHAHAWQQAGHTVLPVSIEHLDSTASRADILVLIHPNNPTAVRFSMAQLHHWHTQLISRGGWLVVDEAFIDDTPEHSLTPYSARPGLIVLRSLGKFFGLAGARVGFVCAQPELLARLQTLLGPWSINTPARWIASMALADREWQQRTRQRLISNGERLYTMLTQHGLKPNAGCSLFQWVPTPQAVQLHQRLAATGILTRLFTEPTGLRFGLPNNEANWQRLDTALRQLTISNLGSTNI
ncbi:MAG: threonine-phosphate decarboxylase [Gammaproteobacteria bacterium]|nr:threonine-phosphate decarboxylase [Gammaproteobacteria bacterium]